MVSEPQPHPRRCDCAACYYARDNHRQRTVWWLWGAGGVTYVLLAWRLDWSDYDVGLAGIGFTSLGGALYCWQLRAEGKSPHRWSRDKAPGVVSILIAGTTAAGAFLLLATTYTDVGQTLEGFTNRMQNAGETITVLLSLLLTLVWAIGFGVHLIWSALSADQRRNNDAAGPLVSLAGLAVLIGTGAGVWWLLHDPWLGSLTDLPPAGFLD